MLDWLQRTRKRWRRSFSDWSDSVRRRNAARWKSFSAWLFWLRRIEPGETDVVRRFGSRGSVRMVAFFNPLFWFLQFGGFLLRYLGSRGIFNLLKGTPAICGIVAPVVLAVWIAPDRTAQAARAAGQMAYFQGLGQFEQADFFSRQLCALNPGDDDVFFRRAGLLDQIGRKSDAQTLLLALAQKRNHQPSLRLLCQQDLVEVVQGKSPREGVELVLENNLQELVARFPGDTQGRFMLATLYIHQGKSLEALTLLQVITKSATQPMPQVWYSQAVLQQRLGRDGEARGSAAVAADQFLMQNAERAASTEDLLQAIRSLVLAYRENEAVQLVDSQRRLAKDEQAQDIWRRAKGEVCAAWSRRLSSRPNATALELAQSVQVLFQAIVAAPELPVVIDELCRLCISNRILAAEVDSHLQTALNSGVSPGLVHFILGTRAATSDPPDHQRAAEHYQLAAAHDASFPGLLNNMANLIADSPEGNYEEAMKLADQALVLLPNQPEIHDTKGKLLLRLGQHTSAIAEFEKALAAPAIRGEVHGNIANAWTALGDRSKADFHRAIADALRNDAKRR
ncbi:MAG: hypothetical protein ACKO2P_14415 [Planctomycetota bacterium]